MSEIVTEEELRAIEDVAVKATPGPWGADLMSDLSDSTRVDPIDWGWVGDYELDESNGINTLPQSQIHADATFIAVARSAVPALVAEVRRLGAKRATDAESVRGFVRALVNDLVDGLPEHSGDDTATLYADRVFEFMRSL